MITLRPATLKDADDLLRWKNDPVTRKNAIASEEEILPEAHMEWLRAKLLDRKTQIFIITEDGLSLGDIRFDFASLSAGIEVSIRVGAEHRKNGIASTVIDFACSQIAHKAHPQAMTAQIVEGNVASLKAFMRNHFEILSHSIKNGKGVYFLKRA